MHLKFDQYVFISFCCFFLVLKVNLMQKEDSIINSCYLGLLICTYKVKISNNESIINFVFMVAFLPCL